MESGYRCLIVDDEKPAHEVLKAHVAQTEGLQHIASAFNGKQALQLMQSEKIDIAFLDIEMPLISGMDLLKTLNPKPAVIITTAFQEFAFEAWENDAVDYLKKPISYVKFLKAVNKAKVYCDVLARQTELQKALSFKVDGRITTVQAEDIVFISAFGNYLKVVVGDRQNPLVIYERLGNLLKQLSKNHFVQIHRSFVVNKAYISNIEKESVILKTGERLMVGRKYQVLLENR
jgi:two-component system, LytTR family, response regulator